MGVFRSFAGRVKIRLTGADLTGSLLKITQSDIPVFQLEDAGDLTVTCIIPRKDYRAVKRIAASRGDTVEILRRDGLYWDVKSLLMRPVLVSGMLVFMFLAFYMPTRILFVKVEGNHEVPTKLILSQAQSCGIGFGASRRQVRSEKVKNALIEQIPQLQWIGVNTSGCVATIRVSEKSSVDYQAQSQTQVSSIVAVRDGVITQCTVTKGTALCRVGQAVKAGQTLISGYTDCGILIKATRAEGEIYARTNREFHLVSLNTSTERTYPVESTAKYSLIIGKNVLKLFNSTGISHTDCVKMYEERYLTLPGGFRLPIGIIKETWIQYELNDPQASSEDAYSWMESYAESYLKSQTVAGSILNKETTLEHEEGFCRLRAQYACLEMIGKVKDEELIQK